MKEPTQTELVFSALKELGAGSYTTRDIMSAMTKDELDRLKHDSKTVSKLLQNLERSGRVKQAEKVRLGSITVSKWKVTNNEVSTDKPVVSADSGIEKAQCVVEEMLNKDTSLRDAETPDPDADFREPVPAMPESEKYYRNFSFTTVKEDTIESLIEDASATAQMAVKSIMLSLQDRIGEKGYSKPVYDVDPLIDGLLEVSDLLSEKIAVKNVIPVIEFLRGLK